MTLGRFRLGEGPGRKHRRSRVTASVPRSGGGSPPRHDGFAYGKSYEATIVGTGRSGGTGRRAGLKIRFPSGSVGSIPTFGMKQERALADAYAPLSAWDPGRVRPWTRSRDAVWTAVQSDLRRLPGRRSRGNRRAHLARRDDLGLRTRAAQPRPARARRAARRATARRPGTDRPPSDRAGDRRLRRRRARPARARRHLPARGERPEQRIRNTSRLAARSTGAGSASTTTRTSSASVRACSTTPRGQRRLSERLEQHGVDALFLAPSADLEYLTGVERQIPNFGEASYAHGWVTGAFFRPGREPVFLFPRMFAAFDLREEPQAK